MLERFGKRVAISLQRIAAKKSVGLQKRDLQLSGRPRHKNILKGRITGAIPDITQFLKVGHHQVQRCPVQTITGASRRKMDECAIEQATFAGVTAHEDGRIDHGQDRFEVTAPDVIVIRAAQKPIGVEGLRLPESIMPLIEATAGTVTAAGGGDGQVFAGREGVNLEVVKIVEPGFETDFGPRIKVEPAEHKGGDSH